MIIFHAAFRDNRLCLWGERPPSGLSIGLASLRRGRRINARGGSRAIEQLPYDAGRDGLLSALNEVVPGLTVDGSDTGVSVIWLPTVDGRPLASSPLIAEPPSASARPELAAWSITAIPLHIVETMDLLCACVGRETLANGVISSRDLAFWAMAMRFAGALVARQQFLPSLQLVDGAYHARWEPVISGDDARRLPQLAQAMPHACRALAATDIDKPPGAHSLTVLNAFLGEVVDQLVRTGAESAGLPKRSPPSNGKAFDSLHDQWMHALRSSDGLMEGRESELAALYDQVSDWRRPVSVSAAAPFRLCFRLEEPGQALGVEKIAGAPRRRASAAPEWYVRYLLQALDDPSLIVPVADAWNARGRAAKALARGAFKPREYLLSALGQAAGLDPQIERSLKAAAPGGYELEVVSAHAFLTEKASLLEQSGFGVMLPAWWTRKGTKLRLSARANVKSPQLQGGKLQGGSGLSLEQIVQFDWKIALGDQVLSRTELEALAKLKAPLVQLRGQWVQLDAEEIQAALDFWKKRAEGQATLREVVQMALGRANAPGGIAFEGITADGWIGDLMAKLEGRRSFEELAAPAEFRGTLRPYQARGYSWLAFLRQWGLGACLADDMGLGKTIQALALIEREWPANGKRPVLLVCPTSVIGNWQKEAGRFTPDLPVMAHHGIARAKGEAFKREAGKHAIVLSSYSLLQRDFEVLKEVEWAGVILDEAQNIKNPETKQARAARSLKSDYRIALTGTPVENNIGDLWAIMEFLNPGFLGTQTEFKRTFFVPIQAQRDAESAERLKRLTSPFILRRMKTDKAIISDLPEKMEMKVYCTLTKEQASLYAAVVEDASRTIADAEGIQRRGAVLATLMKLKQVCNHPVQFLGDNSSIPGRSGKLARLTEMLEEALAEGDRALVFTQFTEMGAIIQTHLQETFGREVLFLHGAVPKAKRDRMVARFQGANGDSPRIFLLSLKAGGTGLNLTAANHVFHFDRWWNPAVENQATDRAFRIGQKRNVQVHKFLCVGTLEEKIDEMIERKQEIASSIVGTGESWLTELSNEQLKDLFMLRKDAVGE
jgi:SNF2 family DNA or RNA helicase